MATEEWRPDAITTLCIFRRTAPLLLCCCCFAGNIRLEIKRWPLVGKQTLQVTTQMSVERMLEKTFYIRIKAKAIEQHATQEPAYFLKNRICVAITAFRHF